MKVVATFLFGSLARAERSEGADTDLLMIGLNDETRHVSIGSLSLFLYPWRQLEKDARNGDLFVCHLVREAKPLIDPDNYLLNLQKAFQFRATYEPEISRAVDFGWFLVSYGSEFNSQLLAKRTLWCVRTILIAKSAAKRAPVFAPECLAHQTSSVSAKDLLLNRRGLRDATAVRNLLRQFLIDEGIGDRSLEHATRTTFIKRFVATSNRVAIQTMRQGELDQAIYT